MNRSSMSSSDSDGEEFHRGSSKRPKCFTKNAILARRNRIKKKKYLEDLEREVEALRAENAALRINVEGYCTDMEVVRKENRYLRNVLASRHEISRLLGVIQDKTGLLTSSSVCTDSIQRQTVSSSATRVKPKECIAKVRPVQCSEPLVKVLPLYDSIDETFEPITRSDVPLAGLDTSDDLSIPSPLFDSGDHDYVDFDTEIPEDWLGGDEELPNIGVCLHVAKKKVSLEFCQYCNENASHSWNVTSVQ